MLRNTEFWLLSILGAVSLALVLANIEITRVNRVLQSEVGARNRVLQQGVQLESLYQNVGRALADLAVQNKDERLRAMLARNHIKVSESGQSPPDGAGK